MGDFAEELITSIRERRSFGGHPLWRRIAAGEVSREGLRIFAAQFFLQVRAFPRAVSALHSRCPWPEERRELAESLYEEETGLISGCGRPHPELFLLFAKGLGMAPEGCTEAEALPETAALIDWFELSTRELPFLEGAAAITLAAEGQVPGAFGPFARALEQHYGLSPEAVSFWDVHEMADREHSDVGHNAVIRHAIGESERDGIRQAVARSLGAWWLFFDGIAGAIARA